MNKEKATFNNILTKELNLPIIWDFSQLTGINDVNYRHDFDYASVEQLK